MPPNTKSNILTQCEPCIIKATQANRLVMKNVSKVLRTHFLCNHKIASTMPWKAIHHLVRWTIFRRSPSNIHKQLHLLLISLWIVNLVVPLNLSWSILDSWSWSIPYSCSNPGDLKFFLF